MQDNLGIASRARDLALRFAERHPSQARRILGQRPLYIVAPKAVVKAPEPSVVLPCAHAEAVTVNLPPPLLSFNRTATQRAVLIRKAAAAVFGFDEEDLRSPARCRRLARPRQHAMLLTRMVTELSYPIIGDLYGGRDHTTVLHACTVTPERIQADLIEQKSHHSLCDEVDKLIGFKVPRVGSPALNDRPEPAEIIETVAEAAGLTRAALLRKSKNQPMAFFVTIMLIRAIWPRMGNLAVALHVDRRSRAQSSAALAYAKSRRDHPEFVAIYDKSRAMLIERWPQLEGGEPKPARGGTGTAEVTSSPASAPATMKEAA